jgi:hypothetical protein
MGRYEFNLRIQGELTDERLEALFEAGCDDMTFSGGEGFPTTTAAVTREASTFLEAALSAVRDIEKVAGLRVMGVESDELVSMADIARRLERTQQSVRYLVEGKRGPGGFPAPAAWIGRQRRAWEWADVATWTDAHLGTRFGDDPKPRMVRALNAALALRQAEDQVSLEERQELLTFVRGDAA